MKRVLIRSCLPAGALLLSGCMSDGYAGGFGLDYGPVYTENYAYNGWYDGAYGSIYDGYWGTDGVFYYRNSAQERNFRRGDGSHFRRGELAQPGAQYHRLEGATRPVQGSVRAPHFPRQVQPQHGRQAPQNRDHRGN